MTNAELDLLKSSREVQIDTKAEECLRIKALHVFDEEDDPDLFFDLLQKQDPPRFGNPNEGYAVQLTDILAVRPISGPNSDPDRESHPETDHLAWIV